MHVIHPLIKPETVMLRRYQETIVSRAIDANTLVVLPTGLGKTIIAAMVAAHRLYTLPGSKVLFLAPTRPLAIQHERTFRQMLTVEEMVVLTGMTAIKDRQELWKNNRVIFATPQTIENDIMRGLDFGDTGLVIFDECHKSLGNYSYVYIAEEYIKTAKNPLILGLTASPSSKKETVREICGNLSIDQIEAKTEHDTDVKPYIQDVRTEWIKVDLPPEFKKIKALIEDILREEIRELKDYGYLKSASLSKISKGNLLKIQSEIRNEINSGMDSFVPASLVAGAIKINHALELLETQGILALHCYLERMQKQKSKAVKKIFSDERAKNLVLMVHDLKVMGIDHPKLDELIRVVSGHKEKKIIIFTQFRDSVDKIIEKLNENDILAHEFIGQSRRGNKKGMTQKEQINVLDNFRNGMYTAIVATSVAEEGLDIPKVDLVIFYEPIPSEIRSIQRRGRTGRSTTGRVIVLMARNTRDEAYYWASVHKERKMGGIVREMRDSFGDDKGQQSLVNYDATTEKSSGMGSGNGKSNKEESNEAESGKGESNKEESCENMEDEKKPNEITIYMDVRERNSKILKTLRKNAKIELKHLNVGDFILSDRVGVERKSSSDFLRSIMDRRLLSQAASLSENFKRPILIIEGTRDIYSLTGIHPNAVRGALASLAIVVTELSTTEPRGTPF